MVRMSRDRQATFLYLALAVIGVLAYFLSQWLSILGLEKKIQTLEQKVGRLSSEMAHQED